MIANRIERAPSGVRFVQAVGGYRVYLPDDFADLDVYVSFGAQWWLVACDFDDPEDQEVGEEDLDDLCSHAIAAVLSAP